MPRHRFPTISKNKALDNRLAHRLISTLASEIPAQTGQSYFVRQYRVAIITDTFMYNFYEAAFEKLVYINYLDYQEKLEEHNFDLLIYVSCWEGHSDKYWWYVNRLRKISEVKRIVDEFKSRNIPTIFHTIEDPVHYHDYIDIAKLFDCVFTADTDMIERYVKDCGHTRVYFGEYGINPILQNPISSTHRKFDTYFFAGTYYNQYPERTKMMDTFFDSLEKINASYIIADRHYGSNREWSKYPDWFSDHIIDKFEHKILQQAHKLFNWNVNFNIVTQSPTMCAMRVYELQALGCNIISNYSLAVESKFKNIVMYRTQDELRDFLESPGQISPARSVQAINNMFRNHTSFHRVGEMLANCGMPYHLRLRGETIEISYDQHTKFPLDDFVGKAYLMLCRDSLQNRSLVKESLESCFAFSKCPFAVWMQTERDETTPRYYEQKLCAELLRDSKAVMINTSIGIAILKKVIDAFFGVTDGRDALDENCMVVDFPGSVDCQSIL